MVRTSQVNTTGSPTEAPAQSRSWRRDFANKLASAAISFGGAGVILVVAAIFIFIAYETIPLWLPATVEQTRTFSPKEGTGRLLVASEDEYRSVIFGLTEHGELLAFVQSTGELLVRERPYGRTRPRISAAGIDDRHGIVAWADDRNQILIYRVHVEGSPGQSALSTSFYDLWRYVAEGGFPIELLSATHLPGSDIAVVAAGSRNGAPRIQYFLFKREENRFTGEVTSSVYATPLEAAFEGSITAVAIDGRATRVVAGTSLGTIMFWDVRSIDSPVLVQSIQAFERDGSVSALGFLLGDQTILVGGSNGSVRSWTWVNDTSMHGGRKLVPLNVFESHSGAVTTFATSSRNKSFLSGDATGEVSLHHQTTASTIVRRNVADQPVRHLSFAPKADGSLAVLADGRILVDSISNPHPEISAKVLFGKVQYEGYESASYTWQSTGGTDDFEPKFSLMPLLVGTVKGAFYALVFALPVALLAAIYTALFAHPKIKNLVKPTVEIMAALPSVVIGFIAALWLAPLLEKMFVDVMLMLVMIPFFVLLAALLWQLLPRTFRNRLPQGTEIFVIIPVLVAMIYVGMKTGSYVEDFIFGGNFRQWLFDTLRISYDQRNSVVVGFAMGFAVIPIIFTISEDALSSVPEHLTAGSLALGATRWQTAVRVILPTASPGIFSAAMVGFGRAVGETMIVLMATGNTPIMNFNPLLGMRTLSANIAVEIPEAPHLGTLYRVLFVSGVLLFLLTFVVNTGAEVIRQRLRKRYSTI